MTAPPLITIVTPSYNRAHTLPLLYQSLQKQNIKNFVWLIVDDGSCDDTEKVVGQFITQGYELQYVKKENGGKHTALNVAFSLVETELTFIVDSDDVLLPNATLLIEKDWKKYSSFNLCGISYLRGYDEMHPIGDLFPDESTIDNFINLRFNRHINGDKAEVWVTALLKQHTFPEYEGEKFLGESYMWVKLSEKHDMLFRNEIIYLTQYLEEGLSRSGRALRIRCPRGGMANALIMMHPRFSLDQRIKGGILYSAYSFFTNLSFREILDNLYPLLILVCYFPGWIVYKKWRKYL